MRVFVKGQEEENPHTQTEEQIGHKSEEPEKHTQEHGHHSMSQIVRLINRLEIEDQVKQDAVAVYKLIAKAEGRHMVSAWMKSISMRLGRWMQWLMLWLSAIC